KDDLVAGAVEAASRGAADDGLREALDGLEAARAVRAAAAAAAAGRPPAELIAALARWGCTPEVIEAPQGYVTHLPLQLAAASDLLPLAETARDRALLVGHLVYGQVELARTYRRRPVPSGAPAPPDPDAAVGALPAAIRSGDLPAVRSHLAAALAKPRLVQEAGRALLRCALEASGPLSHRFTLAEAAHRLASSMDRPTAGAVLEAAALSIAHGYEGPKRLASLRDLPLPRPGSPDFAGRLLVGITSGNREEAHAALRGFFEEGASPRHVAVAFMAGAGHFDSRDLHSDHPFIVLHGAWRAVLDGSFAGDAVPLFVELANRLCGAPNDHELIEQVEEAEREARQGA
ncbi:MAG TPA: hypothetical protein VGB42_06960, partial [Candidatus Thermoplasmatota archaeon]